MITGHDDFMSHKLASITFALLAVSGLFLAGNAGAQTTASSSTSPSSTVASTLATTVAPTSVTPTTAAATTTSSTSTTTTTTTTTSTIAPAVPSVPRNLNAAVTGTAQITVTWTAPESIGSAPLTAYKLIVLTIVGNSSTTSTPIVVAGNTTTYVLNDLRPNSFYAFYLRAENVVGASPNTVFTAPIIVPGPTTTQPAAPTGVTNAALSLLNGQLRVTWTPPTGSPTAVARYRVATVPNIGSVVVDANALAATFGSPRAGTTYIAQIFAIGVNGKESPAVNTNAVAIPAPVTIPPPPPTAPPAQPGPLPLPGQAPTPPGRPQPCVKTSWPKYTYGRPGTFASGAPQGVYMWHDGRYWQVRLYNPGPGAVNFSGSVTANTRVTFRPYGLERNDQLVKNRTSASFAFSSDYDIDSFRISASCATSLRFNFTINGQPVAPSRIFIGRAGLASASDFSIVR
jgi:hypothetical protein